MSDAQRLVTWSALLARWTDFARSAIALPLEGEGSKLRASVPSLIGLQAVTFALAELNELAPSDRTVALDRAEVLIKKYEADLAAIWTSQLPPEVGELARDARLALAAAQQLHSPA